jgi:hypothetical protein
MMKIEPKEYNVCDNSATDKHWTTGSRAKAKDRGARTTDMHREIKNRDIKGGVPTLWLVLLQV